MEARLSPHLGYSEFSLLDTEEDPALTICMSGNGYGPQATIVAVSFEWDFGDGSSGTGKETSHTYTAIGEYKVRLTCRFSNGETSHTSVLVSVADDPIARFTAAESTPLPPFLQWMYGDSRPAVEEGSIEMKFDASASYPEMTKGSWASMHQPARLEWLFGDGQTETVDITNRDTSGFLIFFPPSPMTIRHAYAAAGFYAVTLTLTDNLGYSDTITQTITVGTPGDDEDDVAENFELDTVSWEVDDEDEDDCIYIGGTVQNNGAVAAGVEVTATAYDASSNPVGTFTYWPAGGTNIVAGAGYAFSFFLCDLTVPGSQVVNVVVEISDATIY